MQMKQEVKAAMEKVQVAMSLQREYRQLRGEAMEKWIATHGTAGTIEDFVKAHPVICGRDMEAEVQTALRELRQLMARCTRFSDLYTAA